MDVVVEFTLSYPYPQSLATLQELISIWGLRPKRVCHQSRTATVFIPPKTYQRMFQARFKKGDIDVPEVLQSFITAINVRGNE